MPKSRINKAFMQDWAEISAMSDVRQLRALSQAQQSVLVAMCEYLDWQTRWQNAPDVDTLKEFSADTRTNIMVGICDELIECLTPLFEALEAKIDALQITATETLEATNEVKQQGVNNRAVMPAAITETATSGIYGGALALIEKMHERNMQYYAEAEASLVDNASEALSIVINLFPELAGGSYDETFALGNSYFENQVTEYEADYPDMKTPAACDLYCRITDNADVFDLTVWSAWLSELVVLIPDNAAADLFSRYSPFNQTLLNQIAEWFNRENSLESYFKELYMAYYAGTQSPVAVPPECDCNPMWYYDATFNTGQHGFTVYVNSGENRAAFSAGSGFIRGGTATLNQRSLIQINRLSMATFTLELVKIYCTEAPTVGYQFRMNDVGGANFASGQVGAGLTERQITVNDTGTGMWISVGDSAGQDMTGVLYRVEFWGTGTSPF